MQASFGPGVGTLGRSPDCTLALPDEARHISRQQARIEVAGNVTSITCLSAANPLIINGQELRHGQARRLAHGDRIHVAGYELCFEDEHPAAGAPGMLIPDDPFGLPFGSPEAAPMGHPTAGRGAGHEGSTLRAREGGAPDPFSEPAPFGGASALPGDFDPFADAPPAPLHAASGPTASSADPLGLGLDLQPPVGLPPGRADSIDALFNLEPGLDPLAPGSPLGTPPGDMRKSAQERAAQEAAERGRDPVSDHAPVLSGSFRLPQPIPPTEFGLPEDPVLSWKENDATREAILPPAPAGNAAEIAALTEEFFDSPPPPAQAPGRPASWPAAAPGAGVVTADTGGGAHAPPAGAEQRAAPRTQTGPLLQPAPRS